MDLKTYLDIRDITKSKFARRLGINRCTLFRILNGSCPPGPKLCAKIEEITSGKVTRRELRPDIFYDYKKKD